jgi:hypothetical protein
MVTVAPGVRIAFEEDQMLSVEGTDGVFIAQGTEDQKIVFTTANLEAEHHWKGLLFKSSDARNKLEHVRIEYAGNTKMRIATGANWHKQTNIGVERGSKLSVLHTEIVESKGYGMYVWGDILEFGNNAFENNNSVAIGTIINNAGKIDNETTFTGNGYNGVELHESVTQEITINSLHDDAPYRLSFISNKDIEVRAPLTITAGVKLEVDEDVIIHVTDPETSSGLDSYIDVQGTAAAPVVFTTANLPGGQHWRGILINTSDARNSIDHAIIEYAGNTKMRDLGSAALDERQTNIGVGVDAKLTVSNSTVRYSKGIGIGVIESATFTGTNITYDIDGVDIEDPIVR